MDYTNTSLELFGRDFVGIGTYEIVATLTKDTRTGVVAIQIEVSSVDLPIVDIK